MLSFLLLTVITVLGSAQPTPSPLCDPQTEYYDGVQCCKMCAPGKRMTSSGSCDDPVCVVCGVNEYQDRYNKDERCKRQPYCDPNKNFQAPDPVSSKEKSTCLCKDGYHCSSKECITCVQHTTCQPGQDLVLKGNHTQDTVCRPCPEKTFSSTSNSKCVKLTECAEGFRVVQSGTDRSDTVCEDNRRDHVITGVMVAVLVVSIAVGIGLYMYSKKSTYRVEKPNKNVQAETVGPEPDRELLPYLSVPEENDAREMLSEENGKTDNGNCVAQEDGKAELLSRQESPSQPSSYLSQSQSSSSRFHDSF
ncbi:tumor necrosis factor receptor superfamily member 5 [Austrofundulus limnaeus]|uniref:Tumor necrosis factor receptor superfamily member 5 n=1 Tax=Austrofundulus limnaeus TaxID=52670 RepID=A0A2I4CTT3_AUSLI|nr:PREDICTED: tumor necrosis factor receptor superfamily member 5-like [Austrofundulus limnaeus]